MSLLELLDDVIEQKPNGKLIIDFDSVVYLSAYHHKDNVELAYMDCCKRIYAIEREVWSKYILDDVKIAMTAKTNFRYELYPEYKSNRQTDNEDALALKQTVKEVKKLIYQRLKPILICNNVAEADDTCVDLSRQGWIVSAIDNDVISQCSSPVFNFHQKHWKWTHEGLTDKEIFFNVMVDAIAGKAKDNVKGVKGIGKVKAKKFVNDLQSGLEDFNSYIELFDTPADALLNYRLCDCSQVSGDTLKLTSIKDIEDMINLHTK